MTKGFRTLDGPRSKYKELYNAIELNTKSYKDRTWKNVRFTDGTMRFAHDFNSPGERCTYNAIVKYNKPYIDFNYDPNDYSSLNAYNWIISHNIKRLNIAGNSEQTAPGIQGYVYDSLLKLFKYCCDVEHLLYIEKYNGKSTE